MATTIGPQGPLPISIAFGGTGVTSATTGPTSGQFAAWTGNLTMRANNFNAAYQSIPTANATTTLAANSPFRSTFTGTLNQTLVMPLAASLIGGTGYQINNESTGIVTVNSSGGNLIVSLKPGTYVTSVYNANPVTTAAAWDITMGINAVAVGALLNVVTFGQGSGTYTTNTKASSIVAYIVGAGGGGGGAQGGASTFAGASGGGGGAWCMGYTNAPAATYAYVVGAAGIAGTSSGGTGGNGGNSTFALFTMSAPGGAGGRGSAGVTVANSQIISGGVGGIAVNGNIFANGDQGAPGITLSGVSIGGSGGDSIFGTGGNSPITGTPGAGIAGSGHGSGGGGATATTASAAGAAGTDGLLVIYEFA